MAKHLSLVINLDTSLRSGGLVSGASVSHDNSQVNHTTLLKHHWVIAGVSMQDPIGRDVNLHVREEQAEA